jgi:hypothetical protein
VKLKPHKAMGYCPSYKFAPVEKGSEAACCGRDASFPCAPGATTS